MPTLAGRREISKGRPQLRKLRGRAARPKAVGFPGVTQVALLRRHLRHHAPKSRPWRPACSPANATPPTGWHTIGRPRASKAACPSAGRLPSGRRLPGAAAPGDAADGAVSELQPPPL